MPKASDAQVSRYSSRRIERPVGPFALLEEVLADQPKLPGARCIADPKLWDAENADAEKQAVSECLGCPALTQCRSLALSRPGQVIGVMGAMVFRPTGADITRAAYAATGS